MAKLVAFILGFISASWLSQLGYEFLTEKVEERHRAQLSDRHAKGFQAGWKEAQTRAKMYHEIYHEECRGSFCPK